jgi:uncharacterized protein (TIGR03083 family)
MNTSAFLLKVKQERAALDSLLLKLDEQQMLQPVLSGGWSVKDLLAHIAWFEDEMTSLIRQHTLVGSELWLLSGDERNAAIHQMNREKSLADILAHSRQSYSQLLTALQTLTDAELNSPAAFLDMPADWVPWQLLADNTSDHYAHHCADIHRWLAGSILYQA